jgi:peptide/nickel transport system ATP-binding protein
VNAEAPLLAVDDLRVRFDTAEGVVHAVDGVSWSVEAGETLAIVGESGSGKSVSALAVMGLLPVRGVEQTGRIALRGVELSTMGRERRRELRGGRIAMIFQDPLSALNPVYKVGDQIAEVLRAHRRLGRVPARARAVELLDEVGIPDPRRRADEYPHQLSGGMRQRVLIAIAIALDPDVILADEPTTALDVTVQAEIMELLAGVRESRGSALVLITHDLGVVASCADRVLVMYAGRVAEIGTADAVFHTPRHGYTHALLGSIPRIDRARALALRPIDGAPPSLLDLPAGCAFHPRCRFADDGCAREVPELTVQTSATHLAACRRADAVAAVPAVIGAR